MLAVIVVSGTAEAHDVEGTSRQERADTASRIEAARSFLRELPSTNLSVAQQARGAPRIVNGVPELEDGQWGWTVSVVSTIDGTPYQCGGAYVSPHVVSSNNGKYVQDWSQTPADLRWVVTAAHCVGKSHDDKLPREAITVYGGSLRTDAAVRAEHTVESFEIHEDYDWTSLANDIALLRISAPVNEIAGQRLKRSSIRLPADVDATWLYDPYTALTVHGWGRTSENETLSRYLQRVRVPQVDRDTCAAAYMAYGYSISSSMICAGFSSGGYDSCQGDSGGPLSFIPAPSGVSNPANHPILVGVVSWGEGCARQNLYGVYTNVLHMRPWLEKAVLKMQP